MQLQQQNSQNIRIEIQISQSNLKERVFSIKKLAKNEKDLNTNTSYHHQIDYLFETFYKTEVTEEQTIAFSSNI